MQRSNSNCVVSTTSGATTAAASSSSSSSLSASAVTAMPPMVTVARNATTTKLTTKIAGVTSTASGMEQRRPSKTANIKLINLVKRRPWLYDSSHQNYAKKQFIEKTWTQIGRRCNETGAICKERWRNIRSAFARSINIYRTQSGPNRLKPYYLHQELKFLILPMTKGRKSETILKDSSAEEAEAENEAEVEDEDEAEAEASCEEQEAQDVNVEENDQAGMLIDADEVDIKKSKIATKVSNTIPTINIAAINSATNVQTTFEHENIAIGGGGGGGGSGGETNRERLELDDTETDTIIEDSANFFFFDNSNTSISENNRNDQSQQLKRLKNDRFDNIPDDAGLFFVKSLYYDMSGLDDSQKRRLKINIYEALEQISTTTASTTTTTKTIERQANCSVAHTIPRVAAQSTPTTQVPLTPTQKQTLMLIRNLDEKQLQHLNLYVQNVLAPATNTSPTSSSNSYPQSSNIPTTTKTTTPNTTTTTTEATSSDSLTYSFTVKEESIEDLTLPSR